METAILMGLVGIGYLANNPNRDDDYQHLDTGPDLVLYSLLNQRLDNESRRTDKPEPEIQIYPDLHFTYNITDRWRDTSFIDKRT